MNRHWSFPTGTHRSASSWVATGAESHAQHVQSPTSSTRKILSTDRLVGLMIFNRYAWGSVPSIAEMRGVPIGQDEMSTAAESRRHGVGAEDLLALRQQPDVLLRVVAFLRRALGRQIEMRESAGFLDPWVRAGGLSYSLLRDEGHGLRELVVLLAAAYRTDWTLLVVDEPELHLHPAMARMWLSELEQQCSDTGRRAIVVTHSPALVRPSTATALSSIWYFAFGQPAVRLSDAMLDEQANRVSASLAANPTLVSDLVFSPRPVLVEGPTDAAALKYRA